MKHIWRAVAALVGLRRGSATGVVHIAVIGVAAGVLCARVGFYTTTTLAVSVARVPIPQLFLTFLCF